MVPCGRVRTYVFLALFLYALPAGMLAHCCPGLLSWLKHSLQPPGALEFTQAGLMRVGAGEGEDCEGLLSESKPKLSHGGGSRTTGPWLCHMPSRGAGGQGTHSGPEGFLEEVECEPQLTQGQDLKGMMLWVGAVAQAQGWGWTGPVLGIMIRSAWLEQSCVESSRGSKARMVREMHLPALECQLGISVSHCRQQGLFECGWRGDRKQC